MDRLRDIKRSPNPEKIKKTIFHGVLNSKLPNDDKGDVRLANEAQLLVLAGEGTVGESYLIFIWFLGFQL